MRRLHEHRVSWPDESLHNFKRTRCVSSAENMVFGHAALFGGLGDKGPQIAHAHEPIYAERCRKSTHLTMARRTEIPQLAHVTEHSDSGTRDVHRGESVERSAHGIGVRIVRIVHNREALARREHLLTPRLGLGSAESLDDHLEGKPRSEADRRSSTRVVDVVQAGERKRADSALASRAVGEPTREKGKRSTARIVERDIR